jgi:hypothetical protein
MVDPHRSIDPQRVVSSRGPVSGSGDPLPDEEAIALLDERIDDRDPDIGVVVEPVHATAPQHGRRGEFDLVKFPSGLTIFDPGQYTDPGQLPKEVYAMFGPKLPRKIVYAEDLETSVHTLVARSLPQYFGHTPAHHLEASIWIRVAMPRGTIDVELQGEDVDRPDFTIRDLINRLAKVDH